MDLMNDRFPFYRRIFINLILILVESSSCAFFLIPIHIIKISLKESEQVFFH